MKLSIIVPTYNIEDYIGDCLKSLMIQTFRDFEILVIDDGSTDKSKEVILKFCEQDARIHYIYQENQGISVARNTGIEKATGEYLLFVDGDDTYKDTYCLEKIVNHLKADVNVFNIVKVYKNRQVPLTRSNECEKLYNENNLVDLLKYGYLLSTACDKCISKNFFTDNQLYFKENLLSEDVEWLIRLVECRPTFHYFNEDIYYYRQERANSTSHAFSKQHSYDLLAIIQYGIEQSVQYEQDLKDALFNYLAFQYMVLMAYYVEFDKTLQKEVKRYAYLLRYHAIKRVQIVYWMKKVVGYYLCAKILNLYVRNRI